MFKITISGVQRQVLISACRPYIMGWLSNAKGRKPCFLLGGIIGMAGLGIIPNALIGEMFTSNSRSTGSAVAITTSWLSGCLDIIQFNCSIVTNVGSYLPFWFFTATCALAFLFTLFFIPETKGKTLLEIQDDLGKI